MASLINMLNNNLGDKENYYENKLKEKEEEIQRLKEELFNRIVGSADEMASLINMLNNNLGDKENYYENKLKEKEEEIQRLKEELKKYQTNK